MATVASGSTRPSTDGDRHHREPTAALIKDELDAEREARRSLEQRALSLFASAGVIGSLAGIAGRSKHIGTGPQVLLAAALVALATGALFGLSVAWPVLVEEALDPDELRQAIENDGDWGQENRQTSHPPGYWSWISLHRKQFATCELTKPHACMNA